MFVENASGEKFIVFRLGDTEDEIVRQLCQLALENNDGNISKAARSLGLTRTCLSMRVKKWGLRAGTQIETVQTECIS